MKFFLICCPLLLSALTYDVEFVGVDNSLCLKALKGGSDLVNLQDRPPASINGLRYRAESDLEGMRKTLRAFAYYDAKVDYRIISNTEPMHVLVVVQPGPAYSLASYSIFHGNCKEKGDIEGCDISPQELGLKLGKQPAWSTTIVNAELQVLTELSRCAHPLAYIDKRKVEVNEATKEVDAAVCVQEGPYSKFGPSFLFGLKDIQPRYIERRIAWKEGQPYNSDQLVETQNRLLKTDLFSSVYISHGEELDGIGELPMQLRFTESKHKQFSIGAYWATIEGPGGTFSWTNRNLRGMGETVSLDGHFSKRYLAGSITYRKPDFIVLDQIYRALAQLAREKVYPFLAFTYRFANYVERKFSKRWTLSGGLKVENILVTESATNGRYMLVGMPLFAKYDHSNSVLDPTSGFTAIYSATPYQSTFHGDQQFIKQRFTSTVYLPLTPKRMVVLALRGQLGSIAGTKRENVPLPKLFLGGSENELRGFRYMSVSPIEPGTTRPLGGRSAVYASAELRFRIWDIGIVPFADFGTVTSNLLPTFDTKWYKSVGCGLRYFAYFGPIRLDVGFPINKRHLDPNYQVYASVGQTF